VSDQDLYPIRSADQRQFDGAEIDRILALYGFYPVQDASLSELHSLADSLIEGDIASEDTLRGVQAATGRSLHLRDANGAPDAFLASIPLTQGGVKALLAGRFGLASPDMDWLARPGAPAAALLSWGIGGRSAAGQSAAARGLIHGWAAVYHDVPVYTRARTANGLGFMSRLGFEPVPDQPGGDTLFVSSGLPGRYDRLALVPAAQATPIQKGEAA